MNGAGSGGGTVYMSEDDFDDYKRSPAHHQSSSYYTSNTGNPICSGSGPSGIPSGSGHQGSGGHFSGAIGSTSNTGGGNSQGSSSRNQICCLTDDGKRCNRFAGNASYSKRIQKTVYYKRLKLEIDSLAHHIYICDYHKMVIQNARTRQKKDSDDEINDGDDVPEVDLFQLQVNTLRRYKKHFKISSRPGLNKAQLADILMAHFKTIPVMEKETVTYFIYMIKSEKNKLDNNNRTDGGTGTTGATGSGVGNTDYTERY